MISRVSVSFWKRFAKLPEATQRLAFKKYQLWLVDQQHPSLRFKPFKYGQWSVRVGEHYRATGYFSTLRRSSGNGSGATRITTSFDARGSEVKRLRPLITSRRQARATLIQRINFDQRDTRAVVFAADNSGVIAGSERCDYGGLALTGGCEACPLNFGLL